MEHAAGSLLLCLAEATVILYKSVSSSLSDQDHPLVFYKHVRVSACPFVSFEAY